jgi:hypothetical protein
MRSIADDFALAQSPIADEDLTIHILYQLRDEYIAIVASLKVCGRPISYPELFDKLIDFERSLQEAALVVSSVVPTTNYST